MMYDELVELLRRLSDWSIMDFEDNLSYANQIVGEAADAIEELSSQLDDFKRLCLPLEENKLYKFTDGSFTEVSLMIVPRLPLPQPPKEE